MNKKVFLLILGVLLFILMALTFRPIIPTQSNSEKLSGTLIDIYEGGVKDICFRLNGVKKNYYINRGLEQGLRIDSLKKKLLNQNIDLYYAKHWTPLDPDGKTRHITRLEFNGEVLFTEW